jgi:rhodanese-related sulfurtransferase
MRRTFSRALLIVVMGLSLGLAANTVSPRRIPLIRPPPKAPQPSEMLTLPEAKAIWESGAAFFLDARAPADYAAGHITGAFNLPAEEFDQHYPQVAPILTPDRLVVVYCDGQECELSHHLADKLRSMGFRNVRILHNGWTVWRTAGLATQTGDQK